MPDGSAAPDDDATVRLAPRAAVPRAPGRGRLWLALGLAVAIGGAGALAALLLGNQPVRHDAAEAPQPQARPAGPPVALATEAQILADAPQALTVFRFAANPNVLVLDFPTLAEQGRMLNRVAAFVEKDGAPHDRLLDDAELDALIRAQNATPETFYYGHDYAAAALAAFFRAAQDRAVPLNPAETWLRGLVAAQGWNDSSAVGALISLPRAGADSFVDAGVRATILRHELSHGEFFSTPAFAAGMRDVWQRAMTEDDRQHLRRFLVDQGYDPAIEDLIIDEAQAYLVHTHDKRFVSAEDLKLPQARAIELRALFRDAIPPGWLRDETQATDSFP